MSPRAAYSNRLPASSEATRADGTNFIDIINECRSRIGLALSPSTPAPATPSEMRDFAELRAAMVERQLRRRGISDERVLAAMGTVPREEFVSERLRSPAYADAAQPIGEGQTISQPWIVAAICQALSSPAPSGCSRSDRFRLLGGGPRRARRRGDQRRAPSLAGGRRAPQPRLARRPQRRCRVGDGTLGIPELAPFEAIAVHAAAPAPPPRSSASSPRAAGW